MITVAIIEDEPHELAGLRRAVDGNGFQCVAAYATAETALKCLPALKPDAVIVDLALPRMLGARCIWELRQSLPKTEFLVHTVQSSPRQVFEALQAGASGYLIKGAPGPEIRSAIQEIIHGGSPITPSIARLVVKHFQSKPLRTDPAVALTQRQDQVIGFLLRGFSNKEVAAQLGLSPESVKSHVRNIYEALRVHSRAELMQRFYGTRPGDASSGD